MAKTTLNLYTRCRRRVSISHLTYTVRLIKQKRLKRFFQFDRVLFRIDYIFYYCVDLLGIFLNILSFKRFFFNLQN